MFVILCRHHLMTGFELCISTYDVSQSCPCIIYKCHLHYGCGTSSAYRNPCCYVPLLFICFTRLDVLFYQLCRNHTVCAAVLLSRSFCRLAVGGSNCCCHRPAAVRNVSFSNTVYVEVLVCLQYSLYVMF
jgi:hypothetical protein